MQTLEELKSEALGLPEDQRLELAKAILSSCPDSTAGEGAEIQRLWDQEIMRRAAELESGAVEGIPASEVFAEINAEFDWKR